ncbi:MAG TPA: hypothetical protein VGA62_03195 [Acidimicrobiia bacterium]
MDFTDNPEQELLRQAVADIASGFGHEYFARAVRTGTKTDKLWNLLGQHGFIGVHLPHQLVRVCS